MSSEEVKCDKDVCDVPPTHTEKKETELDIDFWVVNPNILFHPTYLTEFFPTEEMTYERKLNAITRAVIYVTLIVFAFTRNIRAIIISVITLFAIYLVYRHDAKEKEKETFSDIVRDTLEQQQIDVPTEVFQPPTPMNPFSNVLISDYDFNVNKRPAPPVFNENVNNDVLTQAKQLVRDANPDQPEIVDKLFRDLGEQYVFEQSMRPFYSTPNTTIPNDQQAFAEFCYGSMVSCKEGNKFACARNLARHIN